MQDTRTASLALAALGLAALGLAAPPAHAAGNLVTNPGFETGTLTGYSNPFFSVSVDTTDPHSGKYDALFTGSTFPPTLYTDSIATTIGDSYVLSYYVAASGTPDTTYGTGYGIFNADIGPFNGSGTGLSDVISQTGYQQFTYDYTATTASTGIEFFANPSNNGNNDLYLDDISLTDVTPAPEPSSLATFALAGAGLLGLTLRARKRRTA